MITPKTFEEFKKLLQICRKNGVSHVKLGDFELTLSEHSHVTESPYLKKKYSKDDAPIETTGNYTEGDALFWSSSLDDSMAAAAS